MGDEIAMTRQEIGERAELYIGREKNESFREEIRKLLESGNWNELEERFWRDLDFGTGGFRGLIGGGSNRINPVSIARATLGLANYILSHVPESEQSVVIAYDSRHYSEAFALEAARVMAARGIRIFLFSSLRPTPVLSFAVRAKNACSGIMITASHNTAAYNGYKVFWSDGAQVVLPHDEGIMSEVRKVSGPVNAMDLEEALNSKLITMIDREIDDAYTKLVIGQSLRPKLMREHGDKLRVVYTPLHGTGLIPVEGILGKLGVVVHTVREQGEPDGNFPTVDSPNPEEASALKMAIELARKEDADLVLATDPDADRLGIAVPVGGEWVLISGNQLGAMLTDYIFRTRKEMRILPANSAFINTIVTSSLQNRIAEFYGATSFRVLTGFKYIGEKIRQFEAENSYNYVFGGEESYGYLVGTFVRDKDAVSAAAMTAEMTLWNWTRGKSLIDYLKELWSQFGYWQEILISRNFEGQRGQEIMNALMTSLRDEPPSHIALIKVVAVRNFRDGTTLNIADGVREKNIVLPSSNVLQFVLKDGGLVTARPSGTEPKIKFYASLCSENGGEPERAKGELEGVFNGIRSWVGERIDALDLQP